MLHRSDSHFQYGGTSSHIRARAAPTLLPDGGQQQGREVGWDAEWMKRKEKANILKEMDVRCLGSYIFIELENNVGPLSSFFVESL